MISREFPFSEEGLEETVIWLNKQIAGEV